MQMEEALAATMIAESLKVNEDSEKTKALVAALQTDEVKQFIEEKYHGAVVAKF